MNTQGSFRDIIDSKDDGGFSFDRVQNQADAERIAEECHSIIFELAGNDTEKISEACTSLGIADPWDGAEDFGNDQGKYEIKEKGCACRKSLSYALSLLIEWKYGSERYFAADQGTGIRSLHQKTINFLAEEIKKEACEAGGLIGEVGEVG